MDKNDKYAGCPQCGANELKEDGRFVRCTYCNSVYEVLDLPPPEPPRVIVGKNAHVVIGKNAQVEIHGGVKVEPGADIKIEGRLKLIKKGASPRPAKT